MARAYTKELLKAQSKGATIHCSIGVEAEVVYQPRFRSDKQPWVLKTDSTGEWRYSGRECHAVWGEAGEPVELTEDQQYILKCLAERNSGVWYPSAGWVWNTRSETVRRLASLVRKGLVEQTSTEEYRERFVITQKGRSLFIDKKIGGTWLMYRTGAVLVTKR